MWFAAPAVTFRTTLFTVGPGSAWCLADVNSDPPGMFAHQAALDGLSRPFPAPQHPASPNKEVAILGGRNEMAGFSPKAAVPDSGLGSSPDNGPVCPAHPSVTYRQREAGGEGTVIGD